MYRKYVRKWPLLKRNRIMCPEVAVNEQKVPEKLEIFQVHNLHLFSVALLGVQTAPGDTIRLDDTNMTKE